MAEKMKKNSFNTCFSKNITIFATIKNKIGVKFIAQTKEFYNYFFTCGFVHSWITPMFQAVIWATGLLVVKIATYLLPEASNKEIEIIQFLTIFVTLFLEVMTVLLDIYVVQKAHYLASKFILFVIAIFIVMLGTIISGGLALRPNGDISRPLLFVVLFSSALKFIENLLMNNSNWYIVKTPYIFDARGIYISRQLS